MEIISKANIKTGKRGECVIEFDLTDILNQIEACEEDYCKRIEDLVVLLPKECKLYGMSIKWGMEE